MHIIDTLPYCVNSGGILVNSLSLNFFSTKYLEQVPNYPMDSFARFELKCLYFKKIKVFLSFFFFSFSIFEK